MGGQVQQGRQVSQLVFPVGQQAGEPFALEPLVLPGGKIGILQGQGRQGEGGALSKRLVERDELADEHSDRPAIRDAVMLDQDESVLLSGRRGALRRSSGPCRRSKGC